MDDFGVQLGWTRDNKGNQCKHMGIAIADDNTADQGMSQNVSVISLEKIETLMHRL